MKPRLWPVIDGRLYQSRRWTWFSLRGCRHVIHQHGVTGIVNFWRHDPRLPSLVDYYRHYPFPDGKHVPDGVIEVASEATDHVRSGGVIVSMCWGGRNRSGLVAALIVRSLTGCSGLRACEIVRAARPGALFNDSFVDFLMRLKGSGPDG